MFTSGFWQDLSERAAATFAQSLFAVLLVGGDGLLDIEWTTALSVAGLATLLAVLKGFAAGLGGSETGASFGASIPKASVAAVEVLDNHGQYLSEEAAPFAEGTPVDVTQEGRIQPTPSEPYGEETDGPIKD